MTQEHRASVVVSDLGVDTRVELHGEKPHTYRATISNAWNVLYAFGGMTATLALRAAEAAVNRPTTSAPATHSGRWSFGMRTGSCSRSLPNALARSALADKPMPSLRSAGGLVGRDRGEYPL